jgi:hypothetical protein
VPDPGSAERGTSVVSCVFSWYKTLSVLAFDLRSRSPEKYKEVVIAPKSIVINKRTFAGDLARFFITILFHTLDVITIFKSPQILRSIILIEFIQCS